MNLRIVTDSSSDYTREQAATLKIDVVPLILTFDGNDYKDEIDLSKEAFYDYLINQKKYPKTSQPSPEQFVEIFKDAQEKEETQTREKGKKGTGAAESGKGKTQYHL